MSFDAGRKHDSESAGYKVQTSEQVARVASECLQRSSKFDSAFIRLRLWRLLSYLYPQPIPSFFSLDLVTFYELTVIHSASTDRRLKLHKAILQVVNSNSIEQVNHRLGCESPKFFSVSVALLFGGN